MKLRSFLPILASASSLLAAGSWSSHAVGQESETSESESEPSAAPEKSEESARIETRGKLGVPGASPSFRLHGTLAGAKAIAPYQSREFGFGAAGLAALEWGPNAVWGLQAEVGLVGLGGNRKAPPAGLAELDGAVGAHIAVGARVRPLANSRSITYPAGPWLSAAVGPAYTGGGLAPMIDAFVGYDFALLQDLSLGPTAGYMLVMQTDKDAPRPDNAHLLLLGIHGSFDFGSPEPKILDRDYDGILDDRDGCLDDPEDKDGFEDEDGCPDLDNDGDEIPDAADQCPMVAEDHDEYEDEDGCPDPDNDKDDVLDEVDQCPGEPEDRDEFRDEDGCPDKDNDLDGIADLKDLCPNEPETRNGIADNDGCPDEETVRVVGDKIELDQKIHFWTNSDRIRAMSYPVLDNLARFLNEHPEYVHIDVEGHADARGDEDFNLRLSKARAKAVLEFLAERGVDRARLASEGFGSTRPLVEGSTEHAWFMNRRVEFVVTRNRKVVVDPETGAPLNKQLEAPKEVPPAQEGNSP